MASNLSSTLNTRLDKSSLHVSNNVSILKVTLYELLVTLDPTLFNEFYSRRGLGEKQLLLEEIFVFLSRAEEDNKAAFNDNDNDITNDAHIMIGCDFDAEI